MGAKDEVEMEEGHLRAMAALVASVQGKRDPVARLVQDGAPHRLQKPRWRVAVLSASFNPPTLAHCNMCAMAAAQSRADEILLLLAVDNVDKKVTGATLEQRLRMMSLLNPSHFPPPLPESDGTGAGNGNARGSPSTPLSIAVTSHGMFVDQLAAIHTLYTAPTQSPHTSPAAQPPHTSHTSVVMNFCMGYDTITRFFNPHYYGNDSDQMSRILSCFFRDARVTVFNRGDDGDAEINAFLAHNHVAPFVHRIDKVLVDDVSLLATSSTRIRAALLSDHGVEAATMLPDSTLAYIRASNLFVD